MSCAAVTRWLDHGYSARSSNRDAPATDNGYVIGPGPPTTLPCANSKWSAKIRSNEKVLRQAAFLVHRYPGPFPAYRRIPCPVPCRVIGLPHLRCI